MTPRPGPRAAALAATIALATLAARPAPVAAGRGRAPGAVAAARRAGASALATRRFMQDSLATLSGRADAVTRDHAAIGRRLAARGHDPAPHAARPGARARPTVDFAGTITTRGTMDEFLVLWHHMLSTGNGSINDRLYVDEVARLAAAARTLPLLRWVPIRSREVYSGRVVDGRMVAMFERTRLSLFGLIPVFTAIWRFDSPAGSLDHPNPFEDAIVGHHGDLAALERDYRDRFDPRHAGPGIRSTVEFRVGPASLPRHRRERVAPFLHQMRVPWYVRLAMAGLGARSGPRGER